MFNIRPLKLAAKSAPATLQPWTDPSVQACESPRRCESTIHATSGRFVLGSLFINEIRSAAAKTSRQTRMANLNSTAALHPPLLLSSALPSIPAHTPTAVRCSQNLVSSSLFIVGHIIISFGE